MEKARTHAWVRAVVDYLGPLAFLGGYLATRDLMIATWALVAASAAALLIGFVAEKRLAPMPLIACLAGIFFGGLTLVFNDTAFIKVKPTIVNLAFAGALFAGLAMKKNPLKALLGEAIRMPDDAWRTLTVRYAAFFAAVAVLNLVVWQTMSEEIWVFFRMPGLPLLALAFSLTQVPLMMRHAMEAEAPPPPTE